MTVAGHRVFCQILHVRRVVRVTDSSNTLGRLAMSSGFRLATSYGRYGRYERYERHIR